MKREVIAKNPMATIRLPKVDRASTIRWLKDDEVSAIMSTLDGLQDRAVLAAGLSGLRLAEIVNLDVSQVEDQKLRNVVGKGGKVRTVPLARWAWEEINRWADARGGGPLFSLKDGQRISRRSVQKIVSRATTNALGRHINPHALRHTFVTMGIKADIPVIKMARIVGHSSPAVTDIYTHLDDDDLLMEMSKLDKPVRKGKLKLVYSKTA